MISIIYVADSSKHFDPAIKEYEKRLSKKIKLIKLKPNKNWDKRQIISKDTENVNKILKKEKDSFNVMLSLKWKQLDTLEFSSFLWNKIDRGIKVNFIIWWAFGLDEEKLENINYKLNLSKLTFPHSLALLILLEQIYRVFQIINGRTYHY